MILYPGKGHEVEFGELEGQPVPGSAEGEIVLRRWLEDEGHELITTKDREGGELEQNLADADVLITTPFWPAYVTREMIESAPSLNLSSPPGSAATMWN